MWLSGEITPPGSICRNLPLSLIHISTTSGSGTSAPGGSLKTGSAKVTNAAGGVNVRPGPSASGTPVASLKNGDEVQVIKSAGDGWYEITFTGPGGKDTSGYMKGDYLTNS